MEWLKKEAQKRSAAEGGPDCEKGLKPMLRVVESCTINRKLGAITKGRLSQALDSIEVPTCDWFHSAKNNEIYHYYVGKFEAYPAMGLGMYHSHHTLKVIPINATQILVIKEEGYWSVTHYIEWYHSSKHESLYHRKNGNTEQF